eukprot:12084188-Karenia_brevis.AAC.1
MSVQLANSNDAATTEPAAVAPDAVAVRLRAHRLEMDPVTLSWRCLRCHLVTQKVTSFPAVCAEHAPGQRHDIWRVGHLVCCFKCGAYSGVHSRRLAAPCPRKPPTKYMAKQMTKAKQGLHPAPSKKGMFVGVPEPCNPASGNQDLL